MCLLSSTKINTALNLYVCSCISTDLSILPFLFFKPDGAEMEVQAYSSDCKKIPHNVKALGMAQERKREHNITRDLSINETYYRQI